MRKFWIYRVGSAPETKCTSFGVFCIKAYLRHIINYFLLELKKNAFGFGKKALPPSRSEKQTDAPENQLNLQIEVLEMPFKKCI